MGQKPVCINNTMKLNEIPEGIELVWHGVNDPLNLDYFIRSPIPWGEGDVRGGPNGKLVMRHDSFDTHPLRDGEALVLFDDWIKAFKACGKGIQIDLKEGCETMEKMIAILKAYQVDESRLWITTNLKDVSIDDYTRLRTVFPQMTFQSTIPIRFMFREMNGEERRAWLALNEGMGVKRLSVSWLDSPTRPEVDEIKGLGFEINLYHVNGPEAFRETIRLGPHSITSDFHMPEWGLFGRGSGENGFYYSALEK